LDIVNIVDIGFSWYWIFDNGDWVLLILLILDIVDIVDIEYLIMDIGYC
jgi:hypothetical protein